MMDLSNKRALVVGMEKSGLASVAFLLARGANVIATDIRPHAVEGARFVLQADAPFLDTDLIVTSPGVPNDLPELVAARAHKIPVLGEVELAAPYLLGKTIGITGSNGKTTTTAMVGHILKSAGIPSQVGGNIGTPVTALVSSSRQDRWNVLELSSFQLETISEFRADIAVCLNVTQNHLDRHHTFAAYASAKGNLFRTQTSNAYAVLNQDDSECRAFAKLGRAVKIWFGEAYLKGDEIYIGEERLMRASELPVRGRHNVENTMAAANAAHLAGVPLDEIATALLTFEAVEHRLEFVRKVNGVDYYNDSKATSVDATMKALGSFEGRLWVILGGKDKGSDYSLLEPLLLQKAKGVLLIGSAASLIEAQLKVPTERVETLARAIAIASKAATAGDTVLLAPACASFDQFQSYEHRGRAFKDLVNALENK
jgi:UDP-N-acetylmuramoylalanine--D-glutamate ligase